MQYNIFYCLHLYYYKVIINFVLYHSRLCHSTRSHFFHHNLFYSILFYFILYNHILSYLHCMSDGPLLMILGKSNLVHISQLLELVVAIENMYVQEECTIREFHVYSVSVGHGFVSPTKFYWRRRRLLSISILHEADVRFSSFFFFLSAMTVPSKI